MIRVLAVDDEEPFRRLLKKELTRKGFFTEVAPDAGTALRLLKESSFDVMLLDILMPGLNGILLMKKLRADPAPPVIIVLTGKATVETAVEAMKHGAYDYLTKPYKLDELVILINRAYEYGKLKIRNEQFQQELLRKETQADFVGRSSQVKHILALIRKIAPTDSTVFIQGESGTGKELVARALHAQSSRSSNPFVEVNCAAIPEELIESELFGHRKGSFTGASEDKLGKFQSADGGTLFLDEVGDMSLKTQSKVLRALEEQRVESIGSNQTVRVDVRVIAATNKKLEDEIARNAFREDLFYRLNVIPFTVPALRERSEDIPILAAHFLAEFCRSYGKRPKELTAAALEVLLQYPWPGNVRELKNLIERLVIMSPGLRIEPHHLPPEVFRGATTSPQRPYASLQEARSAYEREFVLRKLEENRWNMTRAAAALGLERSHLYRKMKSLGIAGAAPERAEHTN